MKVPNEKKRKKILTIISKTTSQLYKDQKEQQGEVHKGEESRRGRREDYAGCMFQKNKSEKNPLRVPKIQKRSRFVDVKSFF